MADRDLNIRLNADTTGFDKGFTQAAKSAAAFEREVAKVEAATRQMAAYEAAAYREQTAMNQKRSDQLAKVGRSMQLVGLAAVAAGAVAVKSFADFDKAMSEVQAATHESAGNMDLLRKAAIKAGKETSYSATEAAGAVSELAKAGVSTADILGGGLAGALNLAAAGGVDVGEAAETAASAMTQFGLKGKDVGHIADLLAAGAGKAQGSVSDLGYALGQSGLVAAQMGIGIDQATGTLAAFASAGLTGSDAGTSFRTMLLALANPSKQAAETMSQLGISAYDAQGKFVGTERLAGQLQAALGGLSQEQRDSALATIFGSDAIRAANVLYTQGQSGIKGWTTAVNDQGYAAETAATRMDNLAGDLEKLKGALETAFISSGEGASGVLRKLVQFATDAVDQFSGMPEELQSAAATTAIVAGGLTAVGGAALEAGQKVVEVKETMAALGLTAGNLKKAFSATMAFLSGPWGIAVAAATVVIGLFAKSTYDAHQKEKELKATLDATTGAITDQTRAYVAQELQNNKTLKLARELGVSLQDVTNASLGDAAAMDRLRAAHEAAVKAQDAAKEAAKQGTDANDKYGLSALNTSQNLDKQVYGTARLLEIAGDTSSTLLEQKGAANEVAEAAGLAAGATDDLSEAQTVAANAAKAQEDALKDVRDEISKSAASFVSASDAYKEAQDEADAKMQESAQKTADATKSTKDSWEDYAKDVTASFDSVVAKLEEQVKAQESWESNMQLLVGRVSAGTLDQLREMGPAGAALVADLVKRSTDELNKFSGLTEKSLPQTTDMWAKQLQESGPLLANVARDLGEQTAQGYRERLAAHTADIAQLTKEYGDAVKMNVPAKANTDVTVTGINSSVNAVEHLQATINNLQGRTISIKAMLQGVTQDMVGGRPAAQGIGGGGGQTAYATGGFVSGPGTGTSDSIPALLSDGEYVVKASSTGRHRPLLDAINRNDPNVPRFAKGGAVGVTVNVPSDARVQASLLSALKGPAQKLQQQQDVMSASVAGGPPGAGVQRWAPMVLQALAVMGQPASLLNVVLRRMNQESGGNPNAINLWDSNAKAGHPSEGLLQTIPSTFKANHYPGTSNNIRDPWANILASMVYAIRRYGSLAAAYNKKGGYAAGGPVVGPGTGTSDSIPALLSNGEFVVNAQAAKANRDVLVNMNAQGYAAGGPVVAAGQRAVAGSGNGFDLGAYLARSMTPAAVKVDDSELRRANLSLTAWTSTLALAEAKLTSAKAAMDLYTDEIRDAEDALKDATRNQQDANEAVDKARESQNKARAALVKAQAAKDKSGISDAQGDLADATKEATAAVAAQSAANKAAKDAEDKLAGVKKISAKASADLAKATDEEAATSTAAAKAKDDQAAAEQKLTDAKAEALAYAQRIAATAISGAEVTGLFTAEDAARALEYAKNAYAASKAEAQAATDAADYQSKIDQLASAGQRLAAAQAAMGASYGTQKATIAATRAEVEKLGLSYGFTAEQSKALAESAVPLLNTGQTLVDSLQRQLASVQQFSQSVGTLRALGLSQGLIDQILSAGPEKGLQVAQEIIAGGTEMVKKLNDVQAKLVAATNALGQSASNAVYNPNAPVVVTPTPRAVTPLPKVILKAGGGYVSGPGTGTSDSIPAYLSDGEFVVKAAAVARYGTSFLDGVNAMRYGSGGLVARSTPAAGRLAQPTVVMAPAGNSGPQFNAPLFGEVNVSTEVDADVLWQRAPLGLGPLGSGGGR